MPEIIHEIRHCSNLFQKRKFLASVCFLHIQRRKTAKVSFGGRNNYRARIQGEAQRGRPYT